MFPNDFVYVSKCSCVFVQMFLCICPNVIVYLSKCSCVFVQMFLCMLSIFLAVGIAAGVFFLEKRPFPDFGDMPHWRKQCFSVVLCIWGPLGHLWSPFGSLCGGLGSLWGAIGLPLGCPLALFGSLWAALCASWGALGRPWDPL